MLTSKQLNSVVELQEQIIKRGHRKGEAFYLALDKLHNNYAIMIAGTEYDPYHDDNNISKCKQFLLGESNA